MGQSSPRSFLKKDKELAPHPTTCFMPEEPVLFGKLYLLPEMWAGMKMTAAHLSLGIPFWNPVGDRSRILASSAPFIHSFVHSARTGDVHSAPAQSQALGTC